MERMHMLNVFLAVGETQGFAAAANRMRLSPAAVTRAIAGLEKMLGVELLQRTTRNVRLTEAGRRYLGDIRHIVSQIDHVNDSTSPAPRGRLVVSAPESFGKTFVLPCIAAFLKRYPAVDVVASFDSRGAELGEGVDVAVAIGSLRDPGLLATGAGRVRTVLCASPAYLARRGRPSHPGDLLQHAIIGLGEGRDPVAWKFADGGGGGVIMHLRPRLAVTTEAAGAAAACAGLGVARLLSYTVAEPIAQGRLQPLLESHAEGAQPVHILRREQCSGLPKIARFVDLLAEQLRANSLLQ